MAQSKELIYPWKLVIFNSYVTNYQRVNQQLMGRQGLQGIESLKLRLSLGIGDQFGHKVMGKISGKCGENVGKMWGKGSETDGKIWKMWERLGKMMGTCWEIHGKFRDIDGEPVFCLVFFDGNTGAEWTQLMILGGTRGGSWWSVGKNNGTHWRNCDSTNDKDL